MSAQPAATGLLGFLTVERTEDGRGFVGAAMVTDERGFPLEFRATTPVRPSPVQKILFGGSLEPYVSVELCGRKLLKECQRKPGIVLVPKASLLGLTSDSALVVALTRAGESIRIEQQTESASDRTEGRIDSDAFQPIIYESHGSQDDLNKTVPVLQRCFREFDLIEAFDRMRAALKLLAEEDPKFR